MVIAGISSADGVIIMTGVPLEVVIVVSDVSSEGDVTVMSGVC